MRFKTGGVGTSVQFVVVKSALCCSVKSSEGIVQEIMALPPKGARLNTGAGVVCEV